MPCYTVRLEDGTPVLLHGDLGPACPDCGAPAEFLCDFPVGEGRTCDRPVCRDHAHRVAPEIDYCGPHYAEWRAFRDAGGVRRELEGVVPFPRGGEGGRE